MNDGLDTALVLPDVGEKPSKPYRTSPYTVREYAALPYALRRAVDEACDKEAGLIRTDYADESSPQPYTVGRAAKRCPTSHLSTTPQAVLKSEHCPPPSTLQPPTPMPTAYVHPAPSPALHTLNTPERIHHDAAHPDNLATFAVAAPAPRNAADLLDVVSRYVTLTEREDGTDWTHWGTSPFLRGDTHSFAVNIGQNIFKCFTSGKTGDVVDFVMFMEDEEEAGALAWLAANFPDYYATAPEAPEPPAVAFAELAQATAEAAVPAPAAPVAHDGTVYETTDYARFHLLPENRKVDPKHVRKLVDMIQKHNLLHLKPLDVTPDLGVIDGQHRLEAARELGLPIFYKVGQQLSDADISTLNMAGKNWTGGDWLKYHAVKGKPAYVALADFMQRHPRLSFSNAKIMLTGNGGGGHKADDFRAGQWDGAEEAQIALAEQVAELVEHIATDVPTFKAPAHTGFVTVLYHCLASVEGFDAKEMLRKILAQPRSLVTCASHKQWLQMLGEIYNHGTRAENRIRFE
ncbi:MAG: CHC2 zinc finger domain-containing protein [Janthinobacterium lividum]